MCVNNGKDEGSIDMRGMFVIFICIAGMAVAPIMHASEKTIMQEASKIGGLVALGYGVYWGLSYLLSPKKTKSRPSLSFFNEKWESELKDRLTELAKKRKDMQSRLSTIAEEEELIQNALASSVSSQNTTEARVRSLSVPSSVSMTEKIT